MTSLALVNMRRLLAGHSPRSRSLAAPASTTQRTASSTIFQTSIMSSTMDTIIHYIPYLKKIKEEEEEDSCGNHGQEDTNNNNIRYEEYLSCNPLTTVAYYTHTNTSSNHHHHLTYQGVQSSSLNHPNLIMECTLSNQEVLQDDAIEVYADNHNNNTWMEDVSTWLISTLKRRKKKMNKHKLQKRRKKERLGNKK